MGNVAWVAQVKFPVIVREHHDEDGKEDKGRPDIQHGGLAMVHFRATENVEVSGKVTSLSNEPLSVNSWERPDECSFWSGC